MEAEFDVNPQSWGLGIFQLGKVTPILHAVTSSAPREEDSFANGAVLSQGALLEGGMDISYGGSDEVPLSVFQATWELQHENLKMEIQLLQGNSISIPTQISSLRKIITGADLSLRTLRFVRTSTGVRLTTTFALEIPHEYLNTPLTLVFILSLAPSVSASYRLTSARSVSAEERTVRSILETGRFRPPRVIPREAIINNISITQSLTIDCYSQSIPSATSPVALLLLEASNCHPSRPICITDIAIHLESSNYTEEGPYNRIMDLVSCYEVVSDNYDDPSISSSTSSLASLSQRCTRQSIVTVYPGESYTFAYRVVPKHNISTPSYPASISLPPPYLTGDIITPITIRWIEQTALAPSSSSTVLIPSSSPAASPRDEPPIYPVMHSAAVQWHLEAGDENGYVVHVSSHGSCEELCEVPVTLRITNTCYDAPHIAKELTLCFDDKRPAMNDNIPQLKL